MDNLDFTEDEIQHQLVFLGYENIPKHRLSEFKKDLDDLIRHGELKNLISLSQINSTKSPTVSRSSKPPAFTKEKVSRCCLKDHDEGFLHARDVTHDKHQVRNAGQNKEYGQPQGHGLDSYVRHSVAPKLFPPPGLPQQLQIEADASKLLRSSSKHPAYTVDESVQLPLTGMSSADTQRRPVIKRKVLRKHKGQTLVCDESISTEDSGAESRLEERLSELCLSAQHDSEAESEEARSRSNSSGSEASSSDIFESYVRGLTRGDVKVRPKPKSFIRPVVNQRMVKKTDPVAKYFHYKRLWDVFKLPGEVDRTALRLEIKERLAYQPPPPKPRRVYMPNTYIVPTEKKRSALRWEIRTHLANEMIPYKCGY
ncbi:hydrolethalus syndrome protein 1 isoform X2 [Takifugu rubripes]|uniref:hydrolethalus syndrome protein 1 isoform X2 n=1 Tax=Takifugu rubripes TaxID=31033 RepID=UPI001145B5BC|nr:hydrolethalus syndrome protein 1 isoform X2 [Takifugu rubripes]